MYFIVNELQVNNGTPAVLTWAFNDRVSALAKYYTILAAAAVSSLEMHGAYIVSSDGELLKCEIFNHHDSEDEEE